MLIYEFNNNNNNNNGEDLILGLLPKNEFYAVLFGNKYLSYRGFSEEFNIKKVLDFLNINGLKYNIIDFINNYEKKFKILVYGKDQKVINFFSYFYEENIKFSKKDFFLLLEEYSLQEYRKDFLGLDNFDYSSIGGILLGYPTCCINYHLSIIGTYKKHENWVYDSIPHILCNTNTDINFLLNTLFHFGGRGYVHGLNNNDRIFTESLSLINHQPCSYDCIESKKIAYKNYHILKKVDPKYFKIILNKIYKNYIYFDYSNWIAIDINLTENINDLVISYGIISDTKLEAFFKIAKKISKIDNNILLYDDNLDIIKRIEFTDYKGRGPFFIKFKR